MTGLILIDIQDGFDDPKWGRRNNPQMENVCARLLNYWRERHWPVWHVRHDSTEAHSPLRPGQPGNRLKESVRPLPDETVLGKKVNSAFIGTNLDEWLSAKSIRSVVFAGLTTPHCVSTTARMAGNLGYKTYVVSDGTAAFELTAYDGRVVSPEDMHFCSLAALHGEFATVLESSRLLSLMADDAGLSDSL